MLIAFVGCCVKTTISENTRLRKCAFQRAYGHVLTVARGPVPLTPALSLRERAGVRGKFCCRTNDRVKQCAEVDEAKPVHESECALNFGSVAGRWREESALSIWSFFDALLSAIHGEVSDVTRILDRVQHGDSKAAAELLPLVYDELRKLAALKMADKP